MRTSQTNWKALRRPARQKTQPFLVYDSENMHRQYTIIVAPFTAKEAAWIVEHLAIYYG